VLSRVQLKHEVLTVQYTSSLNKIVANIMGYDGSVDSPFPRAERKALTELFRRCSVVQHSVFKVSCRRWRRRHPCVLECVPECPCASVGLRALRTTASVRRDYFCEC
jgi:hypothetical protein